MDEIEKFVNKYDAMHSLASDEMLQFYETTQTLGEELLNKITKQMKLAQVPDDEIKLYDALTSRVILKNLEESINSYEKLIFYMNRVMADLICLNDKNKDLKNKNRS